MAVASANPFQAKYDAQAAEAAAQRARQAALQAATPKPMASGPVRSDAGVTRGMAPGIPAPAQRTAAPAAPSAPAPLPPSMAAVVQPREDFEYSRDTSREDSLMQQAQQREDAERAQAQTRQDTQAAAARSQQMEDEARMWGRVQPYIDMISKPMDFSSTMSASGSSLPGAPAAGELAFARAKDKAGLLATARNKDITDQSVSRGFASDGGDARRVASLLNDTGGYLTDVATKQAQSESDRAAQLEDRNFSATLQQRQSNLSLLPSLLALTRRY